jgi:hypothetical protein
LTQAQIVPNACDIHTLWFSALILLGEVAMKILAGSWDAGRQFEFRLNLARTKPTHLVPIFLGANGAPIPVSEVASVTFVSAENRSSIAGKAIWGAAGAVVLGPLGLLAGVLGGGNVNRRVVEVVLKDGRAVLLDCKLADAKRFEALAFDLRSNAASSGPWSRAE